MGGGNDTNRENRTPSGLRNTDLRLIESENKIRETQRKLTEYINQEGLNTVRKIVTIYDPVLGTNVKIAHTLYKNRNELIRTYSKINRIWNNNASLEKNIGDTTSTLRHMTTTIIRKESTNEATKIIAKELSSNAVELLENEGIFDRIDSTLNIPNAGAHFKDLLQNTLEKESTNTLSKMAGG